MMVAGHQPNYLPYLGFFDKIDRADAFVVVDDVQFVKRGPFGWMHRNRVRTPEGWTWLSVPIKTHGRFHQTIREAEIDPARGWERKHGKTIEWNYRTAPFFAEYAGFFRETYARRWERLADLSVHLIRGMMEMFGLKKPVHLSSELGASGKGTELVIDLCRKTGADAYLSGVHGRDYLDQGRVAEAGVKLVFQEFRHPVYPQAFPGPFVPYLSAVDLLMNAGPRSLAVMRGEGEWGFVGEAAAEDMDHEEGRDD